MTGMRSLFVLAMLGTHAAYAGDTGTMRKADTLPPVYLADATSPDTPAATLRQRAEDLAGAASRRFSEILTGDKPKDGQAASPPSGAGKPAGVSAGGAFAPVWDWLARASQDYEDVVITKLKSPDGWVVVVQRAADATSPPPAPGPQAAPPPEPLRGWSGLMEIARDWLARANRSYRNEVVKQLVEPSKPEPATATAGEPAGVAPPTSPAPSVAPSAPPLAPAAVPQQPAAPVVVQAPQAQPDAAEAKRKAAAEAEIKRAAVAADAKRKADIAAEAKRENERAAELKRKFDQDAEAKRAAEAAEAKRKAEREAEEKSAATAKRIAEAQAMAKREAAVAEAKRKADAEAEAKHKAEDAKRLAEEGDAERKAVAEAEATRLSTEAEEKRKVEREEKVRRAVRAASEAAAAKTAPTAAKETQKTENSGIAPAGNAAHSERPLAKSEPAKSAPPPSGGGEPARSAPSTPEKAPQTTAEAPASPKATTSKHRLAEAHGGRSSAHGRGHKQGVHAKHRKRGHGYHKRRAFPLEIIEREPRCVQQCRCGNGYRQGYRHVRVAKPRKHVAWRGPAATRFHATAPHLGGPYRVRHRKVRRASLTYRR